jgi:hypothetical protein
MNSYFAELYLDIQERIKAEVTEIEWIEQDFGQDAYDKWRPNVAFPAVLIDFTNADYDNIAGEGQTADVTVTLRLLVAPFEQSYEDAPLEVKQGALEYFELEHKLVQAIHGWSPEYTQPLIRKRIMSNNRNDIGLRIRELQFTTAYQEYEE